MTNRTVVEYLDPTGVSPFAKWFARLDAVAAARITTALYRMERGNVSNLKPVGGGIAEYRIDFGPGYRIYVGQMGARLIILLGGGTKKGQSADIFNERKNIGAITNRALRDKHNANHTRISRYGSRPRAARCAFSPRNVD